jgi:putative peptide zinc metalloprotease protein
MVAPGQRLALLKEPTLAARLSVLKARVAETRQRVVQAETTDRSRLEAARVDLAQAEAEFARETRRQAKLEVRAALGGRFQPVLPVRDLPGRWLAEGDLLGHVLPLHADVARVVVSQDDIALVRDRLQGAELSLAGRLEQRFAARLLRAVPQATDKLPAAALGGAGGGRMLTDPGDRDGLKLLQQVFVFDLALPKELADAPFGTRVLVRFDHGMEPAGLQAWRRIRQLFLRQFNA